MTTEDPKQPGATGPMNMKPDPVRTVRDQVDESLGEEDKPKKREIKNPELVAKLMKETVRVDFADPPELDKDGNPKFTRDDEFLCLQTPNDQGNARRFIRRYGSEILHIEKVGWHGWTGTHWALENGENIVHEKAHATARAMKSETLAYIARGAREDEDEPKFKERVGKFRRFANDCGNMKRINSMIAAAKHEVAKLHDCLDQHRLLVNVDNGTLELSDPDNIRLRKHRPEDFISKKMNVKYDPKAQCPVFEKAFSEIQADADIRKLLQVFMGYCLTGEVKEQIIVMLYGPGGDNGKSFLMELFSGILGNYATRIPIAALMMQDKRSGGQASPEIARLPGARFITSAEPEKGAAFSDHMLKIISGEDTIQARHLNEGFIDFQLQGKLCISFNTKPAVRGGDEAFWRRVVLIPFEQQFKKAEELKQFPGAKLKDKDLRNKLQAEASGILNWMLKGYIMWRKEGLVIPDKVRAAIDEYKLETNNVLEFISEWCSRDARLQINATELHNAYLVWAGKRGFSHKMGITSFGTEVTKISGLTKKRDGRLGVMYLGIGLSDEGRAEVTKHEEDKKSTYSWRKKKEEGEEAEASTQPTTPSIGDMEDIN